MRIRSHAISIGRRVGPLACSVVLFGVVGVSSATALPRELLRDLPERYCPVHGGKPVNEDGTDVLFGSPTRVREELSFTAPEKKVVVTLSSCSAGNVLQAGAFLGFDNVTLVRSSAFLAHQIDRRLPSVPARLRASDPFDRLDCYQEPSPEGYSRTVGTLFDPGLEPACGPSNPDCPFGDDFEDAQSSLQRWSFSGSTNIVIISDEFGSTNEVSFYASPECTTATVTVDGLVPAESYVLDFDWRAATYQPSLPLLTVDIRAAEAKADFNNDGTTDILWRNQADGTLLAWFMNGTTAVGTSLLTPSQFGEPGWRVEGVADFDGNGKTDLLWRNTVDGRLSAWFMNGTSATGTSPLTPSQTPDTDWHVEGVGDFNGDGKPDLILRHQTTGYLFALFMDGVVSTGGTLLTPSQIADPQWKIEGVGDFSGDGKPDLVFRHQGTGYLFALFMDGVIATGGTLLTPFQVADTSWRIEAVGDFNSDGRPDLLWRNQASGFLAVFFMNGTVATSLSLLSPNQVSDTNWRIESR
jgi:FG-GAP-like repeat